MTASMTITELRRPGTGVIETTPVKFVWDSLTHSMMQDSLNLVLQVNTVREMPAGADEPVEQVLSVEWPSFDFHGEWKDQWAGQGFAWNTYIAFAQLVSRAPLVRLEMGQHSLVGLLTNLKMRYRTDFEIGYMVTMSLHRNETIGVARVSPITAPNAVPFSQRIQDQQDSIANIDSVTSAISRHQLGTEDLDDCLDNLEDLRDTITAAQTTTEAVAFDGSQDLSLPDALDRAQHKLLASAAAFASIRTQAQQNLLDVQELVSTDVLAFDDVVATLRFEEWTRTQYIECTQLIKSATDGERDARARASKRPRGIHRVRHGDTLARISRKWYGTPDSERFIRDANGLDSIILTPGQELVIPDIQR